MIRRHRDSGVSMIELIIALAVIVLALVALMSSVISSSKISDTSKESAIAYEAARAKIEEIRTYTKCTTFNNIFNYYKPGQTANTSTVTGLNATKVAGVAQPVLEIIFPVASITTPYHLTETLMPVVSGNAALTELHDDGVKLGMPKDLDRSGTAATTGGGAPDLDTTYTVLPVMIRVQWESVGKRPAKIEVVTLITEK